QAFLVVAALTTHLLCLRHVLSHCLEREEAGNTLERLTGAEFDAYPVYIKHNMRMTYVRSVSGGWRIVSADSSNEDKMVDKFTAPGFLPSFMDKYRELPCLWRIQCRDYSNKQKRKVVLDKLLELVKPVYPMADINYLKAKIGSLRSTYNRECKKVQDSLRSGAAADDVYVPRLWYYDSLRFLSDQTEPRPSLSTLPSTSAEAPEVQPGPSTQEEDVEEPSLT
ncbi:hypothetical protein AB205_0047010, partial [Aquarana catesbeiana]